MIFYIVMHMDRKCTCTIDLLTISSRLIFFFLGHASTGTLKSFLNHKDACSSVNFGLQCISILGSPDMEQFFHICFLRTSKVRLMLYNCISYNCFSCILFVYTGFASTCNNIIKKNFRGTNLLPREPYQIDM
jgi:hypothetical protein